MKRLIVLLTLVSVVLFLLVPVFSAATAQSSQCDKWLAALENMSLDSPGYDELLEKLQEYCGQELDYAALVALYVSTDGDNWTDNTNWLETEDYCSWFGVTCAGGRVTFLLLGSNQLEGPIPPELGNLSKLRYLWLAENEISGSIPPELGNLSILVNLNLSNNQFSGPIPPELGNLSKLKLKYIFLSYNQLNGPLPPELGTLERLEGLHLDNNQLSGPIPLELGNMGKLQDLNLARNELSGTIPSSLGNLSNLERLYLSSNKLSCWETEDVWLWALGRDYHTWDYPRPGDFIYPDCGE